VLLSVSFIAPIHVLRENLGNGVFLNEYVYVCERVKLRWLEDMFHSTHHGTKVHLCIFIVFLTLTLTLLLFVELNL
jgi:hypothetical protein